jgi:hypothetical protein
VIDVPLGGDGGFRCRLKAGITRLSTKSAQRPKAKDL